MSASSGHGYRWRATSVLDLDVTKTVGSFVTAGEQTKGSEEAKRAWTRARPSDTMVAEPWYRRTAGPEAKQRRQRKGGNDDGLHGVCFCLFGSRNYGSLRQLYLNHLLPSPRHHSKDLQRQDVLKITIDAILFTDLHSPTFLPLFFESSLPDFFLMVLHYQL
jgi:hypothetical protein